MQQQQPVIRTYRGRERRMAEEAYRLDAAQAEKASWYPVAHRWMSSWAGEELSVVFEYRGPALAESLAAAGAGGAAVAGAQTAASSLASPIPTGPIAPIGESAPPTPPPLPTEASRDEYRRRLQREEHDEASFDREGATADDGAATASWATEPEPSGGPPDILSWTNIDDSEGAMTEAVDMAASETEAPAIETEPSVSPPVGTETSSGVDEALGVGGEAPVEDFAWDASLSELDWGVENEVVLEPVLLADPDPEATAAEMDAEAPVINEPEGPRSVTPDPIRSLAPESMTMASFSPLDTAFAAGPGPGPRYEPDPAPPARPFAPPATPIPPSAWPEPVIPVVNEPGRLAASPAVRAHARAVVQAIDLHAGGEPLRLIRSGFPQVPSLPVLERRRWLKENADFARRVLNFEPRGHRDMYGAILLPPYRQDADICVLFMHNEGYSTMCGHGVIAIATGLVEEGLYPATSPETVIRFETPAGLVTAAAKVHWTPDERAEVSSVKFRNVPAYLDAAGLRLRPDGLKLAGSAAEKGTLLVDIAFGGAYYGVVDAADLGLRVVPSQAAELTRAGAAITELLRRDHTPIHPTDKDLGFVYGTIIVDRDPATSPDGRAHDADLRNITIFADGEVDRSPCGSGTSALLARMHARGEMEVGHQIVNAGVTGEAFIGRIEQETYLGKHPAVVTSVEGSAFVTGYHTFVIDDRDPLGDGFLLR